MRLLGQYIFKPILKFLINGVKGVVMWTLRQIIMFIRFALPHAIRLILSASWWTLKLLALSVISLFKGLVPTVERLAEYWQAEALAHGFPTLWETQLYSTFRVLAVFTIVTGWAILLFMAYVGANIATYLIFQP